MDRDAIAHYACALNRDAALLTTLLTVLPVFALILAGWLARRIGVLGPTSTSELNRFVVYLALPALLFDIVANARPADIWQPGFIAAFGLGAGLLFAATLAVRLLRGRPLADAAIEALNASYANTGYMGFPLALVVLGREALAPTLIATILTVCVLFAVAIVLIEIGLQARARPGDLALKVFGQLLRNPLLVAPLLAAIVPLGGLAVPAPAESFLKLLGAAASPCALVALGLFLAGGNSGVEHPPRAPKNSTIAILVFAKLIIQPALTFGFALVIGLPPALTHAAVLLAALPIGTGPFMLAEFYRRDAALTGRAVLISTLFSVLTVSALIALLGMSPG